MLLRMLDTPAVRTELKVFELPARTVTSLQNALRDIVERADITALTALLRSQNTEIARFEIDDGVVERLVAVLDRLRQRRGLPALAVHLPSEPVTGLAWYRLAQAKSTLDDWSDDLPPIILEVREQTAAEALTLLTEPPQPAGIPHEPIDISWVRRVSLDGDTVPNAAALGFDVDDDWTITIDDALQRVASQLGLFDVLEACVGAYVDSVGPGPFLERPAEARPLVDTAWKALPLFRTMPLLDAWILDGAALDSTLRMLETATPNVSSVLEEWPRLKLRFRKALERARRDDGALLLLANDESHPFWPGHGWWRRVSAQ